MAAIRPDLAPNGEEIARLRAVAAGREPPDLAIRGANVAFVHTAEFRAADVLVAGRHIAAVTPPRALPEAAEEIEAAGFHLLPGFCDAHIHVEYTLLPPGELARLVVPKGTTALFADPDCSANVFGLPGVDLLAATRAPLRLFLQATSRVPRFPGLEVGGAALSGDDIEALVEDPRTVSFGESNPYQLDSSTDRAMAHALAAGRRINGHTARMEGEPLWEYLAAGVSDDHNAATWREALERMRRGAAIAVQSGTMSNYLAGVLAEPEALGPAAAFVMFSADDKYADDLALEGHIDHHLRSAVELGVPPVVAVRMATLNAAAHFRVDHLIGSITPTRLADLVLVSDVQRFDARIVWVGGRKVAESGTALFENPDAPYPPWVLDSMNLARPLTAADVAISAGSPGEHRVRVMEIRDGYYKREAVETLTAGPGGALTPDPTRDIAKVAVVDRHRGTGAVGRAFIRGFGLRAGALAVSTNCENQNIVVVGVSDTECAAAVNAVVEMGGGFVVTLGGRAVERVRLGYGGMMSLESHEVLLESLAAARRGASALGCAMQWSPFMVLSFVGLASVPDLALTELGLIDVSWQQLISPLVGDGPGRRP